MYNFDQIIPREGTDSVKFDGMKRFYPDASDDAIPMFIADMDFAVAPEILEAMHERLEKKILGYTGIFDDSYYDNIINWYKTRFGLEVKKEEIVISNGVVPAVNVLVRALTKEGDNIIITTPSYGPFFGAIQQAEGRNALYNRLINTNGYYTMDFEDFEEKCKDPKTTMFILCNPHNPTGRIWTVEELTKIHEICQANGVFIVSDEIHADLTRSDKKVTPIASLFPDDKNIVTCTAPSKTFNLAGNGHSNIFIRDEEIRKAYQANGGRGSSNPLSVAATKAAYAQGAYWLDELREYLDGNFAYVKEFLAKELPDAVFTIPEGTYLAWIGLGAYGYSNDELEKKIGQGGVVIESGRSFVDNCDSYIRVNMACPLSVVKTAFDRIAKAVKS
ncbi:MAG: pyridoxal phosphate-dependent aminotransferase [Eubacteriales bacterium]|nr:pyridoxal phosphate-dependent aminotransferase [Eubacteriales bacterium]